MLQVQEDCKPLAAGACGTSWGSHRRRDAVRAPADCRQPADRRAFERTHYRSDSNLTLRTPESARGRLQIQWGTRRSEGFSAGAASPKGAPAPGGKLRALGIPPAEGVPPECRHRKHSLVPSPREGTLQAPRLRGHRSVASEGREWPHAAAAQPRPRGRTCALSCRARHAARSQVRSGAGLAQSSAPARFRRWPRGKPAKGTCL